MSDKDNVSDRSKGGFKRYEKKGLSPADQLEKDRCTLFVGNLPMSIVKRQLESKFKEFGKIVSSRFRSCPVSDKYKGTNKKYGVMKKEYIEGVSDDSLSQNAYVVFSTAAAVEAAVSSKIAGSDLFNSGHVVRLDYVIKPDQKSGSSKGAVKVFDRKKSVYVPHVPVLATDKDLLQAVEKAHESLVGSVRGVRIVRTPTSGAFAYVLFAERSHATIASKLGEAGDFLGTQLRFERVKKEDEIQKDKQAKFQQMEQMANRAKKNSLSRMKWQARLTKKGNPKVVSHLAMPKRDRQEKMLKGAQLRIKYKNAKKDIRK